MCKTVPVFYPLSWFYHLLPVLLLHTHTHPYQVVSAEKPQVMLVEEVCGVVCGCVCVCPELANCRSATPSHYTEEQ